MKQFRRFLFHKLYQLGRSSVSWLGRYISPAGRQFARLWPYIDAIEGFLVPGQEKWLFETARSLPDGAVILEIGSFKGRSTCCLAFACVGTQKHVYLIDTFCGNETDFVESELTGQVMAEGFFEEWRSNVETCGLSAYVTPLIGFSRAFYSNWSRPIHFLVIDGSHQYEDILADFDNFFPHVVPGGLVALHDVTPEWEGPYRVWMEHVRLKLESVGFCSTFAYGRKPRKLHRGYKSDPCLVRETDDNTY